MRDLKGAVQNEVYVYSEGLELGGSASMDEAPGVVLHWVKCIARE